MASPDAQPVMRFGYRICRCIAQLGFITLFRGRAFGVQHVPRRGGVLLVSNHQSFLDPVLATLAVPRECQYLARDSLFHNPVLRRVIEFFNTLPVRRGTADLRAIREIVRRLARGNVVLVFPEGTRTTDGQIGPMRGGVALMARKARVPLVPTLIQGAFEAWPRSAKWPRPRSVLVAYDQPLYPHRHPELSDEQAAQIVRQRILSLKARFASHPNVVGR